jgi:glutaminase
LVREVEVVSLTTVAVEETAPSRGGSPVVAYLDALLARHRPLYGGEVAAYIPELASVDPAHPSASPRSTAPCTRRGTRSCAGRSLQLDEGVYRSEAETGHRHRAIAHLLRNFDVIVDAPDAALDLYFRRCSSRSRVATWRSSRPRSPTEASTR